MINFSNNKTVLKLWGAASISITAICIALRIVSLMFFYDAEIGYYTAGAAVPTILNVLLGISVVAPIIFCVVPALRVTPRFIDNSTSRFFAAVPALGFAFFTVTSIMEIATNAQAVMENLLNKDLALYVRLSPILIAVTSLCALVFFVIAVFKGQSPVVPSILTGIFTLVWLILAVAQAYFDSFVQMNAPNKTVFMFGVLSVTLLIVNEMRLGLPKRKPYMHLFGATVACIFTLTSSIPSIVCFFTKDMPSNYTLLFHDIVLLSLGIFALARLISLCFGKDSPWVVIEELEVSEEIETNDKTDENAKDEEAAEDFESTSDETDVSEDFTSDVTAPKEKDSTDENYTDGEQTL